MASEYLKWKYRDVQPDAPVERTKKQRRQNWWYYHKWHVGIGVLAAAIAGNLAWHVLTQVHPDYQIAYVGTYPLSKEEAAAWEEAPDFAMQREADTAAGETGEAGMSAGLPQEQDGEHGDAAPHEPETDAGQPKRSAGFQSAGALYQDSRERANENRSSAWILLIMGSVGLIVIVLGIMGMIPLHFSNPYLFYGVMAAVFILFIVAGIVSMNNAKLFAKKAESENSLRDAMLAWCRENLRAQELDSEIGVDGTESEEALYFKRFECIKAKLNYQFVNLDQCFLEKFIDDSVYDMIYEKKDESA